MSTEKLPDKIKWCNQERAGAADKHVSIMKIFENRQYWSSNNVIAINKRIKNASKIESNSNSL
jgi:hypothetical protein